MADNSFTQSIGQGVVAFCISRCLNAVNVQQNRLDALCGNGDGKDTMGHCNGGRCAIRIANRCGAAVGTATGDLITQGNDRRHISGAFVYQGQSQDAVLPGSNIVNVDFVAGRAIAGSCVIVVDRDDALIQPQPHIALIVEVAGLVAIMVGVEVCITIIGSGREVDVAFRLDIHRVYQIVLNDGQENGNVVPVDVGKIGAIHIPAFLHLVNNIPVDIIAGICAGTTQNSASGHGLKVVFARQACQLLQGTGVAAHGDDVGVTGGYRVLRAQAGFCHQPGRNGFFGQGIFNPLFVSGRQFLGGRTIVVLFCIVIIPTFSGTPRYIAVPEEVIPGFVCIGLTG